MALCERCCEHEAEVAGLCASCAMDLDHRGCIRYIEGHFPVREHTRQLTALLQFQEEVYRRDALPRNDRNDS